MDGFNEDDTIPSFSTSQIIEEVEDGSEEFNNDDEIEDHCEGDDEGQGDSEENHEGNDDDEDEDDTSLDSYEGLYRATKRFKKMTPDKNSFKVKVYETLKKSCEKFGDYAVSGKLECTPLIVISLKKSGDSNVGECIKFPLHEQEISKIVELFDQSPYGKGTETIIDTSVRNSYQLRPDSFEILNSDWDKFMRTVVVNQIKKDMSLECSFVPSLHRLLLYTPGSFFKPHRDSEKEDNMFGTLVVQLPSKFKGGQLVVRHDGKTKVFDLSSSNSANNSFSTFFSAFYCDCEHEILPVTEGFRICLIYNLIANDTEIPQAPRNHSLEMELVALLQNWKNPRKLVYALSHKYSQSNLSLKNLKTTDKIVANILKCISITCDLNIYLALLEKDCNGNGNGCEDDYNCRGCTSDFDEDDRDNEVSHSVTELIWIGSNEKIALSELDVNFIEEVIPDHCFDRVKPYHADCDHTGNEGVQISKSYRCAAIVFWPKKFTLSVLLNSKAPQKLIVGLFLRQTENYFKADCDAEMKIKIEEWAKSIVAKRHFQSSKENSIAIVNAIVKFNNVGLIQNLIRHVMVNVPGETFPVMIAACEKYGWEAFSTAIEDMFRFLSRKDAITNLTQLLGYGNITEKQKQMLLAVLEAIHDIDDRSRFYSVEDKIKQHKEDKDILESLVNAMIRFNDVEMLQKLFKCAITLHSDTILLLSTICDKFGWEPFTILVADKFKKLSKNEAVKNLTLLIQNGLLNEEKKKMCLNLFNITMDKNEELIKERFYYYQRANTEAEIIKKRKDERELLEPFINAAVKFNNLELVQNLFQRVVPLHSETIPLLINQCEIFGWSAFTNIFLNMFGTLTQKDAIESLALLTRNGNLKFDKKLCSDLFQMVLDKKPTLELNTLSAMSQDNRMKHLKEEQDVLFSICAMAEKIRFNLLAFAKTKSFKDFVPVLLRLIPKGASSLNTFWGTIAFHFISEMGKESIKVIEASWRRGTSLVNVCCKDCVALNNFLQSNKESESFKMGEKRRKHLQQRINLMQKIAHRTEYGALIVIKTEMSGAEAIRIRNLSQILLAKLRSVMPHNS